MPNLATSGAGPSSLTSLPPIRHAMSLTNVQPMDYRLSPTARHRQRTSDMLSSIGSSTAVNSHTSSQAQDHSHLSRRTPRETDPLLPGRPALQDGSGTGVPLEMTTLVEMVQRLRQNVVLLTAAFDNSQQRPPPETHATIEEINSSETNPFDDAAAEGGDSGSVVDSSEGAAQPNTTSSQDLAPLGSTSADSGVKEQPSSIAQEDHATQGTALTEQERISSVLQDLIPPSALPTPSDGETRVLDSVAEEDELPATPKARVAVHA
ncbi:hypothetical protein PHLCEN_2v3741 [Hermanssonia centrifuga]|uniref:Uncharacterized protein n=1 Tax=Hermanssonia centrifuga TaxID=98765 RepID=A0A2R6QBM2_9APHY|nr:hypothetical protein PHLCEN_2v3741 [Hermanssonia centrifuga]